MPKTDNQWFVVPDAVLERDDLTAHEKLMLVNLCRLIREDGCVRAGLDELAGHCGIAVSSASRAIRGLEKRGIISVCRDEPNAYYLKNSSYWSLIAAVKTPESHRPVPEALQRLWAAGVILNEMSEHAIARITRRLPIPIAPKKRRSPAKAREELLRRFVTKPEESRVLVPVLSAELCGIRSMPTSDDVLRVLSEFGSDTAVLLATLWGIGEEIVGDAWVPVWDEWIEASAGWRAEYASYGDYAEATDLMSVAEEIAEDAERQVKSMALEMERLKAEYKKREEIITNNFRQIMQEMSEAHRRELASVSQENARLREQLQGGGHAKPQPKRCIAVLGDPSRTEGYRSVIEEYGHESVFANALDRNECRRVLARAVDAIVLVTAYSKHSTGEVIAACRADAPLYYVNRSGLGEFRRVFEQEVLPGLAALT